MRKPVLLALALALLATSARAALDPGLLAGHERALDRTGRHERPGRLDRRASNRIPNIVYVGGAAGGVWKSINGGAHLGADLRRPAGGLDRRHRRRSGESGRRLGGHRRGESAQQRLGRRRRLPLARRRPRPGPTSGSTRPSASTASSSTPPIRTSPGWRRSARPGARTPSAASTRPRTAGKTWSAGALRRRADRRRRPGDRPAQPEQAVRRHVAVPALALVLQVRRPRLRAATSPTTAGAPGSGSTEEDGMPEGRPRADRPRHLALQPRRRLRHGRGRRRALCCARTTAARTWKTVNDRYDVNPRPFYFAHIARRPRAPRPPLQPGLQRPGLERRRQELRRPDPRRPDPRRLPRHLDRSARPQPPLSSATTAAWRVSHDRGPDRALRHQPAARPVLPRGGRQRRCPTTSTAACRTTAPGAARAPSGSRAASATTTG